MALSSTDITNIASLASTATSNAGNAISALGQAQADFGSAAADLLGAQGDRLQADAYTRAAGYADVNLRIAGASTAIQLTQLQRQLYQANGTTSADVAKAGFSESGSALDILRSNAQQGSLARQVVQQQGLVTEQGYAAQEDSFKTQASISELAAQGAEANSRSANKAGDAASSSSTMSDIGTGIAAIAAIALLFSDRRLKRDIVFLRQLPNGLGLYRYRYLWSDHVYEGVMAQEVEVLYPHAVVCNEDGWLKVAYDLLGLQLLRVA